jgi:hypothetical protein
LVAGADEDEPPEDAPPEDEDELLLPHPAIAAMQSTEIALARMLFRSAIFLLVSVDPGNGAE